MFGPNPDTDEAGAHPTRQRCQFQEPYGPWESTGSGVIWISADLPADYRLHVLCKPSRELAAALYFRKMAGAGSAFAEGLCQDVGGCNGILDGKIDPAPPTGVMACAASPMQTSPGRYHRC